MYLDEYNLIPNIGIKNIKFGMRYEKVLGILKYEKIPFIVEVENHENTDKVSWQYIEIENYMVFIFAKGFLWKIEATGKYKGKIINGISLGMKIDDCKKIDKTLSFDDWNEIYFSKNNYIIVDECETQTIITLMIGIEEIFTKDSDSFYTYDWIKKYENN